METLGGALEFVLNEKESVLQDVRQLVEMESPSTDKALLDRTASFISSMAEKRISCTVETVEQKENGNHLRIRVGKSNDKPVLMLAHYDTVWPAGTLSKLPFRVDGGKATGPGIFDMKTGLVQGLWAIKALGESGLKRPAVLLCTSDEEIGSPSSRSLIEDEARKAAAVLVLEPSRDGMLKTARKGTGMFEVRVTGRASHAGLDPTRGVSAVDELARLILELHALTDMEKGTTLNVGVISGGSRRNVVAGEASAEVDLRIADNKELERVLTAIKNLKPHNGDAKIEVSGGLNRPPMVRNEKIAGLYGLAKGLASQIGFDLGECSVGGASDGNFCAALGLPVLDGLGAVGDGAHSLSEHVVVDEIPRRAALVAGLLAAI